MVEANTIMIAACISTLHPVYELVCQKLRRQPPDEGGVSAQGRHSNAADAQPGTKRGFWSMLLERDSRFESTIASRLSRSRSQRGPAPTTEHDETTDIPIRTLEDAQDTQVLDAGQAREAGGDKALVKLYHAGLAPDPGRS